VIDAVYEGGTNGNTAADVLDPVVIMAGADIVAILVKTCLETPEAVQNWLNAEFPTVDDGDDLRHYRLWQADRRQQLIILTFFC
jgi:hypothetical protein